MTTTLTVIATSQISQTTPGIDAGAPTEHDGRGTTVR